MDKRRTQINAVVDTNVVAYHLLGTTPFAEEAGGFWQATGDICAPALWEAELANVLWMAMRKGILEADDAILRLGLAARLRLRSIPIRSLWQGALARAARSGIAVYDTLFIELAHRERIPLATFDARLCKGFPDIAKRPRDLLSA